MKKMFTKSLAVLLAAFMLLTAAPLSGFVGLEWPDIDFPSFAFPEINLPDFDFNLSADAATIVKSGCCGKNLTWTLDSDGVLTISGTGEMTNYDYNSYWVNCNSPWYSNRSAIKTVIIENGVTSIGEYAFYDCTKLTSVTIGNSVTSIGSSAFYNTAYYNDANNWTDGVLYIGKHLIKAKTNLSGSYAIKDGTKTIAGSAFYGYESLTSVTIPDSVTSIGDSAFYKCTSLTSVTIPDSVTSIGEYAFFYCESLTSVTIPDSVTSIGDEAFWDCTSLTSVTIPDSVTNIGYSAFYSCDSLTSVTIGDSVKIIGDDAFRYCTKLTSVTIPDSVTSIGDFAFSGCTSLTDITVDADNTKYCSEDGVLFNKSKTELIQYPVGNARTSYTIPDSVTSIGDSAFSGCRSLASVTIPDSVTSIGTYAFAYCTKLTSVTIPDSVTSIGDSAFYWCTKLTSVTIGNSVTSIGEYTFRYCYSLTSVTIGDSVTSIGDYAFEDCTSLTSVTIPDSVTSIGEYAFSLCTSLTSVHISDIAAWCNIDFDGSSANPLSYAHNLYLNGTLVTTLTIPDSMTSIGGSAFKYCTSLTTVTIPDSVTSIGAASFYSCTSLTSVIIGDSVTRIGKDAFWYCTSLTDVYYEGKEEQWKKISISSGNTSLTKATIHFDYHIIPADAVEYNGHYYKLYNKAYNWTEAEKYCEKKNGHLVTVKDPAESAFITELLKQSGKMNCYWTGMYKDPNLNKWMHLDGSVASYTNWAFNEPNGYDDNEIYVHLFGKGYAGGAGYKYIGEWNDCANDGAAYVDSFYDLSNFGFICEWDNKQLYNGNVDIYDATDDKQLIIITRNIDSWASGFVGNESLENKSEQNWKMANSTAKIGATEFKQNNKKEIIVKYDQVTNDIVLSHADYYNYIIPKDVALAFFEKGIKRIFSTTAYMRKEIKNGKPYISTVFAKQKDSDSSYIELQHEELVIAKDREYSFYITADNLNEKATYYISQDEAHKIESKTGVFSTAKLREKLQNGKDTVVYCVTASGVISEEVRIKIRFEDPEENIIIRELKEGKLNIGGEEIFDDFVKYIL